MCNSQHTTAKLSGHPRTKSILQTQHNKNTTVEGLENKQSDKQVSVMTAREKQAAQVHAEKILSKYLNESCANPKFSWLVNTVRFCISQQERDPEPHDIVFKNSTEAAIINTNILKEYQYDFDKFINSQTNTILSPGSEFRSIQTLERLLGNHQDWHKIKRIISEGCDIPTVNPVINEETRKTDLHAMILRGNHKSTQDKDNYISDHS